MTDFRALESGLERDEKPIFPVEVPDGIKHWREIKRQVEFRKLVRLLASAPVVVYANPNAGRRSARQASAEGIRAGVFDMSVHWGDARSAWPEFKGYDARGRAGTLSPAQIGWGNAMHGIGHSVACFFTPMAAIDWLRGLGCPLREAR